MCVELAAYKTRDNTHIATGVCSTRTGPHAFTVDLVTPLRRVPVPLRSAPVPAPPGGSAPTAPRRCAVTIPTHVPVTIPRSAQQAARAAHSLRPRPPQSTAHQRPPTATDAHRHHLAGVPYRHAPRPEAAAPAMEPAAATHARRRHRARRRDDVSAPPARLCPAACDVRTADTSRWRYSTYVLYEHARLQRAPKRTGSTVYAASPTHVNAAAETPAARVLSATARSAGLAVRSASSDSAPTRPVPHTRPVGGWCS